MTRDVTSGWGVDTKIVQRHRGRVTTNELRAARQAWANAHLALDTALTRFLPAALAAHPEGGEELQKLLNPEQTREVSELYGRAVGLWAAYRELLRHTDAEEAAGP